MKNTKPTIMAIIPVFRDERVFNAVRLLTEQKTKFDGIIIQDPEGKYLELENKDLNIIVNNDSDSGLFDGIDKCVERYDADYYYLQGADDELINTSFLEEFYLTVNEKKADIYHQRIYLEWEGHIRLWPSAWFVKNKIILPPHFGSIYKSELLKDHKMSDFVTNNNIAADSAWFYSLNTKNLEVISEDQVGFKMFAGGLSNNGMLAPLWNGVELYKKLKTNGYPYFMPVLKFFSSIVIKSFYFRVGQYEK
jgi:hypothetical protein